MKEKENIEEPLAEENKASEKPQKKIKIWRRKNIHLVTPENDIKFRGPLSYRHLRIIGWVLLALSEIVTILKFVEKAYGAVGMYGLWPSILGSCFSLMAPLFLIAVFGVVLNAKDGYRRMLIMYGGLSLLVYVIFVIVFEHYLVGLISAMSDFNTAQETGRLLLLGLSQHGYMTFNLFIDLLLCTLVTFFINYRPKKFFQGNKIYIFRSLVAIPILYEITSIVLKVLASESIILLSPFIYPLLTTKTPMSFIIFIVMAIFIKNRERYFIKKGKTHDEYKEFEKTNVNSLHFSITLSVTIVISVIIDLLIMSILLVLMSSQPVPEGLTFESFVLVQLNKITGWGFGQSAVYLLIIPIVMLFDYKKTHKDSIVDTIIPVAGIGLVALVYIEGGFDVLRNWIASKLSELSADEGGGDPAPLINSIKNIFHK